MQALPLGHLFAACSEHVRSLLGTGTEQATNKPIVSFKCSRCYVVDFAPYGRTGSLPGKTTANAWYWQAGVTGTSGK